jgi:hypothetical protein
MKILLLSVLLLPVSLQKSTPQSQPVSPPEALCTARVSPDECTRITATIYVAQLGSVAVRSIQFVLADDAAFKDEKLRVETMRNNRIVGAPSGSPDAARAMLVSEYFESGVHDILFELERPYYERVSKIYIDETTSCHETSPSGAIGAFSFPQCIGEILYATGFADGVFAASINALNSMNVKH